VVADKELGRNAARRLAIIRHAEEGTGNVAKSCRYYCEEEFAERYNGADYAKLMPEYDGGARLAGLYQKCVTVE
jgi:hypothetical protein